MESSTLQECGGEQYTTGVKQVENNRLLGSQTATARVCIIFLVSCRSLSTSLVEPGPLFEAVTMPTTTVEKSAVEVLEKETTLLKYWRSEQGYLEKYGRNK